MPSPDFAIRQAVATALRQSLLTQLSKAETPRERQEMFARIRAELSNVLANASSTGDGMTDIRTRAMLATLMHEIAEEFAADLESATVQEPLSVRVTTAKFSLMHARMPAADLAALCAKAKAVLTEARTKARRIKVVHRSEAGLQHVRRLERIGLDLLTVGELADVAADKEPGQEVVLMREQLDVLQTVLDGR